MKIRLSKSSLEKFKACARCFWLEKVKDFKQPDGIHSGLPMGMDRVLKVHYDAHRSRNEMPPELAAQLPGWKLYPDQAKLKDFRNWRKGLSVQVGDYELSTALDDLLVSPAHYAMLDYKTKAKATDEADTARYYQTQADCYTLALEAHKMPTSGLAHFAYYFPDKVGAGIGNLPSAEHSSECFALLMNWRCQLISIPADPQAAKSLVLAAGKCLEGDMPNSSEECGYCAYGATYPREGVAA